MSSASTGEGKILQSKTSALSFNASDCVQPWEEKKAISRNQVVILLFNNLPVYIFAISLQHTIDNA